MKTGISLSFSLLITLLSCVNGNFSCIASELPVAKDTVAFSRMFGMPNNGVVTIKETIDLYGMKCLIPKGITLNVKGGLIKNGTLVGDMTLLKSSEPCFNKVRILGTWNVPVIKSSLFEDLSYDNALKDVVALSSPSVHNKIMISEGYYHMSAHNKDLTCLTINSNTEFIFDGTIQLAPNSLKSYNIIEAAGNNIIIRGSGTIIGDKHTHTGKGGEWGMGIMVKKAHNVSISGLTVKECWGDCIYVGDNSQNVTIEKCILDNGRRQGISITSAIGVLVKDCRITNISGTAPGYAIDIEPNINRVVDKVIIENVVSSNCNGGIEAICIASNASIGSVTVQGCTVTAQKHYAL